MHVAGLIELFGILGRNVITLGALGAGLFNPLELQVEGSHLVVVPLLVDLRLLLVVGKLCRLEVVPEVPNVLHDIRLDHLWILDHNFRPHL